VRILHYIPSKSSRRSHTLRERAPEAPAAAGGEEGEGAAGSRYIPTRYPNGHPEGAPGDHYGPLHSAEAIVHAGAVLAFVRAALA
jgi:hypothetical protein